MNLEQKLESRDFYELCQEYRHSQEGREGMPTPGECFENLKKYILTGELPWPSFEEAA